MELKMKAAKAIKFSLILFAALLFSGVLITPAAIADNTVLYFVRHAEKQNELTYTSDPQIYPTTYTETCYTYGEENKTCCIEELSDLGFLHRDELAYWFDKKQITPKLTHVFSSHKQRTTQTVQEIADDAGLPVQRMGPDYCMDTGAECDTGCESGKDSIDDTVAAILDLPQGSTALVGQHSGTIYLIMKKLGIDTRDPDVFPRDSKGKVAGYNNLWKVKFMPSGEIKVNHIVLDLILGRTN